MNTEKLAWSGATGKKTHSDRKAIRDAKRANWSRLNADVKASYVKVRKEQK